MPLNRDDLLELDRQDPLADHRDAFDIPEGVIYFDGNSLGALPKAAKGRVREVVEQQWGQGLIRSWNEADWINLPQRLGAKIAPLIGAQPHEVISADSTSVNLFKLAAAALRIQQQTSRERRVILSEPGNFPTDLYMLQGLCDFAAGEPELVTEPADSLIDRIDESTALVVLTHVHYKSGRLHDMTAITRRAHECGALVLWDLSHSTGAVPVELNDVGADFAIGCGYKYLNGGPGAPAFMFVAERHLSTLQQPLSGWFGHESPFDMRDDYAPAPDIRRVLTGTTSVVAASLFEVGLDRFRDVDMFALRKKSMSLTEHFIQLVEERCPNAGFELVSPREPQQRGSQVSFAHPEGYAIVQALIDRGVIGDYRSPDILRFGFAPLYVQYVDLWGAVEHLADIMCNRLWENPQYRHRRQVT
ncbi:kynureninase [Saccharospirillum salsuginis]|uniref:Kynureninase n=1 Tax=Saccharospirillum salsuginis TaxID=418750 RepID=A0A918K2Y0_9GAMM|nr:kynureninase [Saccharospirillum salsuginis]GGX46148.1 kynureninase [Saccharospirillum salsuginis]